MVVAARGAEVRSLVSRIPYKLRVGDAAGGAVDYTSIQAAIDYAQSQTPTAANPWTIDIYSGTYNEQLTLYSYIHLMGVERDSVIITQANADTLLLTDCVGVSIENLTLQGTAMDNDQVVNINANTAACSVTFINVNIVGARTGNSAYGIYTQGANGVTLTLRDCDITMTGAATTYGIYTATTSAGADSLNLENCNIAATTDDLNLANDCVAVSFHTSYSNGGITIANDANCTLACHSDNILGTITKGAAGVMTYKNAPQQYEVWAGMSVQQAITAAAADAPAPAATAPYTILIHPGIYDEIITCATWVNLKGVGPKGSVVIYQLDSGNWVTVVANVELENLVLRAGAPTGVKVIVFGNQTETVRFTDIIFEVTTPGVSSARLTQLRNTGTYIFERCSYNIGGTGIHRGVMNDSGAPTIRLIHNDFTFENANAFHIYSNQIGTWISEGNRWAGTCAMFDVTAGTFTFDSDTMICTAGWTNTGSTMMLRNCASEAPVVAGNLATVRMKNCSYRTISRTGTGNIVDESPDLKDAPWHIERWTWQAALANSQVGVRGVPLDAGTGQVIIETLDSGVGVMAVETNPELARALGNEFTPARTPRFLTQISAHTDNASAAGNPAFDPHVTMFYGLRQTLGNALPAHPEHHAGFIWTGAAFNASSNDGVATQTTALTTPSDDAQHQLEVIVFGGLKVEFYVDGVLVATHSTRIPTAVLDWQHLIIGLGTGGGDTVSVTIRNGGTQECPA